MTNRSQQATTVSKTLILAAIKELRRSVGKRVQTLLDNHEEWCMLHEVGMPFLKVLTMWLWKNGYRWKGLLIGQPEQ